MWSLSLFIDASTVSSKLASPLLPSFRNTNILSPSSLRCRSFCIVMGFLVLWSICLSSSLVHFKNGPEHLTIRRAWAFIPLIRFLQYSLVSLSFLILLRYSVFLIFPWIFTNYYYYYYYLLLLLLLLLLLFHSLLVFHTSFNWRSFAGVWVTASLLTFSRTFLRILADVNNAMVNVCI